ncbi:MAG TPA: SIS domain-containing protein, partial [Ensifer sp.]|nr:SIS domain-containing protein [Ensifer sp.]
NILVLFDIRRYEQEMETMAKIAAERGIFIILFTDTWGSPIVKHAKVVFRLNIEVPSAWDSSVMTLVLVEALIEAVQSANWDSTRERMSDLEELFDTTSLFRRPIRREKRGKQQN